MSKPGPKPRKNIPQSAQDERIPTVFHANASVMLPGTPFGVAIKASLFSYLCKHCDKTHIVVAAGEDRMLFSLEANDAEKIAAEIAAPRTGGETIKANIWKCE